MESIERAGNLFIKKKKCLFNIFSSLLKNKGHKGKVVIGMDVAASEFWNAEKKVYDLDFKTANNDGSKQLTGK
jgi:enolase